MILIIKKKPLQIRELTKNTNQFILLHCPYLVLITIEICFMIQIT